MLPVIAFIVAVIPIVILQTGLILGAPWGKLAMGGKFGDIFPLKLRVSAAIQLSVILFSLLIVLVRGEVLLGEYLKISSVAIWFVVTLYFVSAILNIMTSSKYERILGIPTALTMCVSSLFLALGY